MTLVDYYDLAVKRSEIKEDPVQIEVLKHLQRVADDLAAQRSFWFNPLRKTKVKGLYLYGSVGVGKSYLVDLFYRHVKEKHKTRFHYHHFMQYVDAQLRHVQGQKDPLKRIAAIIAKSTRLLCLDEFLVNDIADAMILGELLNALFEQGVVLVTTSNTEPDALYLNGLQRARFLPAIELLKTNCQVLQLADFCDYRLGRISAEKAYQYPLNHETEKNLTLQFNKFADKSIDNGEICVQNREINCYRLSDRVVWFKFEVICNVPRSQLDYLEIADRFDSVFVSDIPQLGIDDTVRAILLMNFIDVMYDQKIRVIISAAVPIHELYMEGAVHREFQRTVSRLEEMQSIDYLNEL